MQRWKEIVSFYRRDQKHQVFVSQIELLAEGFYVINVCRYRIRIPVEATGWNVAASDVEDVKIRVVRHDWARVVIRDLRYGSVGLTVHDMKRDPILAEGCHEYLHCQQRQHERRPVPLHHGGVDPIYHLHLPLDEHLIFVFFADTIKHHCRLDASVKQLSEKVRNNSVVLRILSSGRPIQCVVKSVAEAVAIEY